LKYNLLLLPSGGAEKIPTLLKLQEEFSRWATEWALSGGRAPPPQNNPLKYFARNFLYAGRALDWLRGLKKGLKKNVEVRKMQPPLLFDAQLRLGKERDVSRGVFIDLPLREVRVRKWGSTLALPLTEKAAEWILARVREGGRLALAAVWVGPGSRNAKLHVALIFRREVVSMQARRLLVVDFNALHNGVSYAVVEGDKIITKGVLRPNVSKIAHMQKVVSKLDSVCAKKDKVCDAAMATKSRVWRLLRVWEDEAARKLIRLALQYKAAILVDLPKGKSIMKLKEVYVSEKKIFLNFGRLWESLRGLAEWHGVPCHSARLYSTICPHCERKMSILQGRRVRCACGFEANRDEVPALWAAKLFPKLSSFSSPFPLRRPRPLLFAEVNSLKIRADSGTALPAWED